MRLCHSCQKELADGEFKFFGRFESFEEGKKVWCFECWADLQEYLKRKWTEEKIPELRTAARELLKNCENNKKRFNDILTQTKKFLTKLDTIQKENLKIVEKYSKQSELFVFSNNENGAENKSES